MIYRLIFECVSGWLNRIDITISLKDLKSYYLICKAGSRTSVIRRINRSLSVLRDPFINMVQLRLRQGYESSSIVSMRCNYMYSSVPNFNGCWVKPPLRKGRGWVIISHCFIWMWLLTHATNSGMTNMENTSYTELAIGNHNSLFSVLFMWK